MSKMKNCWSSMYIVWFLLGIVYQVSGFCDKHSLTNGFEAHVIKRDNAYKYRCNDGFVSNIPSLDSMFFNCKGDGIWKASAVFYSENSDRIYLSNVTCQLKVECPNPPDVPKGVDVEVISRYQHGVKSWNKKLKISSPKFYEGDKIKYKCSNGYEMTEDAQDEYYGYDYYDYDNNVNEEDEPPVDEIECMPSGLWNNLEVETLNEKLIQCKEIVCNASEFVNITNGNVTNYKEIYNYFDVMELSCDEGYRPINHLDQVLCSSFSSFESIKLDFGCEPITCEPPTAPINGRVKFDNNSKIIYVGEMAYFDCDYGNLIGDAEWTCQSDGSWDSSCVVCEDEDKSRCSPPCLPLGATMISTEKVFYRGDTVKLGCRDALSKPITRTCMENRAWSGKPIDCIDAGESSAFTSESLSIAMDKIRLDKEQVDNNESSVDGIQARTINVGNSRGNDVYFLIDISKSITEKKAELRAKFLKALLPQIGISDKPNGTRLAFYLFAGETHKDKNHHYCGLDVFKDYKEAQKHIDEKFIFNELNKVQTKVAKGTAISTALDDVGMDILAKKITFDKGNCARNAEQVVIIISDGWYNKEGNPTDIAKTLKEKPYYAEIFSILLGADERNHNTAYNTMKDIASNIEDEEHFFPIKEGQLDEVINAMIENGSSLNLQCGQTDLSLTRLENDSKPVYKHDAVKGAWPWMAQLVDKNGVLVCGGSLIDSKWILTAAHCTANTDKVILKILELGDNGGVVSCDISKTINHENYNTDEGKKFAYDIALIKLTKEVKMSKSLLPICLPDKNATFNKGVYGVVTGWGKSVATGNTNKHLQQMQMKIQTCEDDENFNNEIMFCAGSKVGDKVVDACQGDSGGPFSVRMTNDETRYVQIGIVSFGKGCKKEHGVYTKLEPSMIKWIKETMKKH